MSLEFLALEIVAARKNVEVRLADGTIQGARLEVFVDGRARAVWPGGYALTPDFSVIENGVEVPQESWVQFANENNALIGEESAGN